MHTIFFSNWRRLCAALVAVVSVLLLGACAGGRGRVQEAGREPPVVLGSSVSSGTEVEASVVLNGTNRSGGREIPHLRAVVRPADEAPVASLSVHHRVLHFPGTGMLSAEQYAEVQSAVSEVLKGTGTGVTRRFGDGEDREQSVEIPIDRFIDADHDAAEYVVIWAVGSTSAAEQSTGGAVGGSFVWDGEQVYSLIVPD